MADIVSVREFARRMKVSLPAVQKAVRIGRISAQRDEKGRLSGIDWDTQKVAWVENSNSSYRRKEIGYSPDNEASTPYPAADGKPVGGRPRKDSVPEAAPPSDGGMTLAEITRARALVNLSRDKLALDVERGKYVPIDDQVKAGAALAAAVVSALYNIPQTVAPHLCSMTDLHEITVLLTKEIDKAVEGLRKSYGH